MESVTWQGVAMALIAAVQVGYLARIAMQNNRAKDKTEEIHKAVNSTAEKQVLKIEEQTKLIETLTAQLTAVTAQLTAVTALVKKGNGERGIK